MQKTDVRYATYVQILREELVPAMGCTEPIALAYAAAKARETLGCLPDKVELEVSGNIVKNVKSVVVPNTNGMKGLEAAAAVGIVAGCADKKLEVISEVTEAQKEELEKFLKTVPISVRVSASGVVFDIVVRLYKGEESAVVRIAVFHTNIIYIEKNGKVLLDMGEPTEGENALADKSLLSIEGIVDFADTCEVADVKEVIGRQIAYNTAIAEEGIKNSWGANVGSTLLKYAGTDVRTRAKAMAAAGSDARMSGCELPVVINSGSGNQGMTVSLPVLEYAKELQADEETLYRALVVANLCAIHQKTGIGRLSAYCGAVSAGTGAACGIAYLYGEKSEGIGAVLQNSVVVTSGIVCDGAKPACAGKIAAAVEMGLVGYYMYKDGQKYLAGDGICGTDVEKTVKNVGRLAAEGMRETDKTILTIMVEK
ncbi:MAG: serine dehydratase subunit alpha family protein [Lachnospiraceae bacterium]|nr:serine dehydratase subunit alpha family protein [Lachnospiraceae bacterium]